jgi:hypothetical protein
MQTMEVDMGFGRGVLFWLLGIPIPIIILLALFWHHWNGDAQAPTKMISRK